MTRSISGYLGFHADKDSCLMGSRCASRTLLSTLPTGKRDG